MEFLVYSLSYWEGRHDNYKPAINNDEPEYHELTAIKLFRLWKESMINFLSNKDEN